MMQEVAGKRTYYNFLTALPILPLIECKNFCVIGFPFGRIIITYGQTKHLQTIYIYIVNFFLNYYFFYYSQT